MKASEKLRGIGRTNKDALLALASEGLTQSEAADVLGVTRGAVQRSAYTHGVVFNKTTDRALRAEVARLTAEVEAMRPVVDAARAPVLRGYLDLQDALAAFDAVPGDVREKTNV